MEIKDVLKPKSSEEINSVIDKSISEFEKLYLPRDFKWRRGQKEVIQQIIQTYLENKYKTVILDAPVGSGKSLVAMATSFILNDIGKKGYVLTSEISLQDQYEKDINRFDLWWGSVKGLNNYKCIDNDDPHPLGTCRIRNANPKNFECYDKCPYFSARDNAINSNTSVLNYNYWLIMQNISKSNSIFPPRDFTICDEAHKILDIIQNHYSPRFTENTVKKLKKLAEFFSNHGFKKHKSDVDVISKAIDKLWETEDQDIIHEKLIDIELSFESFLKTIKILKKRTEEDYSKSKPPKDWRKALFISDWLKDNHCKVEDYNYIITQTSTRNIVKNPSQDQLLFNCLEERFLMNRYFHQFTGFTVLMSATFADPRQYMKTINLKNAKYIKMENIFSFEKSPIYFYPKRRMSYKYIDSNREWLYGKINEILEKHKEENGIIHSSSYDLTTKIKENLSKENLKRIFSYGGTEEKRVVLESMKLSKARVLIGPSLTTGIDLYDDLARFSIIAKIPYPSMSDRFIKTKMKINSEWYQWKTCIEFIQSIGRTIRNEKDWAITYILDGSLSNLIHQSRKSFSPEFLQRLVIINE